MSIEFASSFIGSSLAMLLCNPMDILKTRLQVQSQIIKDPAKYIYKDYIQSFKTIYKVEGMRGFYKGLTINIIIFATGNAVAFYICDYCKTLLSSHLNNKRNSSLNLAISTLIGGSFGAIIHPLYIVRTRIQTQIFHDILNNTHTKRENFLYKTFQLLKNEGIKKSFIGLPINIAGCSISFFFTVFTFETMMKIASKRMSIHKKDIPLIMCFLFGCMGRITSSFVDFPMELVKNRMFDPSYHSFKKASMMLIAKNLYAREGIEGFYRGFTLMVVRTMPQIGILFMTYEFMRRFLKAGLKH